MRSRLAVAALALAVVGCGNPGDAEGSARPLPVRVSPTLYEICGADSTCDCAETCQLSGKFLVCEPGPVRPNGETCHDSGACVNGTCCQVSCPEDALACTRAACTPDEYTCAQVVDCPPRPCFGAGACDGDGNCTWAAAYLGDGTSCGLDLWCYEQQCRPGCFIAGQYRDPAAANPLNPCRVCDPSVSREAWTDLADGVACGAGKVCAAGGCADGCLIGGALVSLGARNPANECQACTATHADQWTDTTDFCTDDGDPCTLDRCAAAVCTHPPNPSACRPGSDSMFGCGSGAAGTLALLLVPAALGRLSRRRRAALLGLLLLALAAPAGARAAEPRRPRVDPGAVAVVTLGAGAGVTEETTRFVTQALGAELHARGIPTVSQEDVRATLGFAKEREALGCTTEGCFAELGGTLGVRRIITGSLARLGDSLVFDVRLVDTAAGAAVKRSVARRDAARGDDAFLEAIPELVDALFPPAPDAERTRPFALALAGWGELDRDRGGAGLFLFRWSPTPALRASGGLIATAQRLGGAASLGWIPWNADGRLYPFASLELLLLAASPVSPGVGISAGVEWRVTPRLDLALEVPFVRLFHVPDDKRETYPFAALSAAWRL